MTFDLDLLTLPRSRLKIKVTDQNSRSWDKNKSSAAAEVYDRSEEADLNSKP